MLIERFNQKMQFYLIKNRALMFKFELRISKALFPNHNNNIFHAKNGISSIIIVRLVAVFHFHRQYFRSCQPQYFE